MRSNRIAEVLLIGVITAGCQSKPPAPSPASSMSASDEQTTAQVRHAYQAANPGTEVGVVNAVDPTRRIFSVGDIPTDRIRTGVIMSVMIRGGGTLQGVVYDRAAGYLQLRYEPLRPGQAPPSTGDLAIWFPGAPAVAPGEIPPVTQTPSPAMAPADAVPAAPPATQPMTDLQPASRPVEGATTLPATPGVDSPATLPVPRAPESRPGPDLNK